MKADEARKTTEDAFDELAAALEAGHSEKLTAFLAAMGRFHRYSFTNVLLISTQRPNATRVAGFNTWKQFGRHVKKGEKGIAIIAPITYRGTTRHQRMDRRCAGSRSRTCSTSRRPRASRSPSSHR